MYNEEMGSPSFNLPGEPRNGLWNSIGTWSIPRKEALVAPWRGTSDEGDCRMASTSTRSSGHGIPWLLSSGSEGEVRMRGASRSFFGFRRKENMTGQRGVYVKAEQKIKNKI
jgi:hypothetical protein